MLIQVEKWAARAQSLTTSLNTQDEWRDWAKNPMLPFEKNQLKWRFIPAAYERRASLLTKYALDTALELTQEGQVDYGVFASRHGEIDRTVELMESIVKKEILSPMAFSQSVHNAAAGLYTIAKKSHLKLTSLAAGEQTFDMALTESASYLFSNPEHKILLVMFDQILPDFYQKDLQEEPAQYAVGFILSAKKTEYKNIAIENNVERRFKNWPGGMLFLQNFIEQNANAIAYSEQQKKWVPIVSEN